MAKLKEHGVYYGLSHTYGYRIRPGNRGRYLAYDEIAAGLNGNTYGLINFAEDVQDLLIESVIGALKHENPYTRQKWADDPALAYIELQNEDDIFFYTTENVLAQCPTYRKDLMRRFAEWLAGEVRDAGAVGQGLARGARRRRDARSEKHRRPGKSLVRRRRPAEIARRPSAHGSSTMPPFSTPCRTSSTASSSRRSARRDTGGRCAGRRGKPRPWCRTITTCGPITWWAGSTGTTISAATLPTRCSPGRAADTWAAGCSRWRTGRSESRSGSTSIHRSTAREGPAHLCRLRHGPARLELVVRVPVGIRPRGVERDRGQLSLGRVECRHPDADRTVPGPGADGDARRRDARAGHLLAKAEPGRVAARAVQLQRQDRAARRHQEF